MAIATLKFDLSVPEELASFALYFQADKMYWVLHELIETDLRNIVKYDDMTMFSHEAREFLFEIDGSTPVTVKTTPDKIDGGTMASLLRSLIWNKLRDNQVNMELLR